MKLGLICSGETRNKIENMCKDRAVLFSDSPDLYLVETGMEQDYLPCLVFSPERLETLLPLLEQLEPKVQSDKIIGTRDDTYHLIDPDQVLFFESRSSAVYCQTETGEYRLKNKLYELEERLPDQQFIRTSRSYIVNINQVMTIAPWFSRRLLLTFSGTDLTVEVSKNYVNAFKAFLGMR